MLLTKPNNHTCPLCEAREVLEVDKYGIFIDEYTDELTIIDTKENTTVKCGKCVACPFCGRNLYFGVCEIETLEVD